MNPISPLSAAPLPQSQQQPDTVAVRTAVVRNQQAATQAVQVGSQAVQATGQTEAGQQLKTATDKVSKLVNLYQSELEFTVDEESGTNVVKVLDKESKEVIRQMPSEEMLRIAKSIDQIVGVLLNQKA